jgi:soluble lytic murein transglycosylase-like protein
MLLCAVVSPQTSSSDKGQLLVRKATAATEFHRPLIELYSLEAGIDPMLAIAVIAVESKGDSQAYSPAGAMGLMQLMPATCDDYGVADPYDPEANVQAGTRLLSDHLATFRGNLTHTLAAYNAGPGRVRNGTWRRIRATRNYVRQVLAIYRALRPNGDGWAPTERASG